MKLKLNFELVPDGCWYSNLRTVLKKSHWDIIRKKAYERADGRCMICHRKTNRLEAHERWSYDVENKTQKLSDIVAICHSCHSVIHIGRTQLMGKEDDAIKHFCYVNKCSYSDYIKALGEANSVHQELNKVDEWNLDISFLEEFLKEKE